MKNMDMTPTFEQATRMAMLVLQNGSPEGVRMAEQELLRYGRQLDRLVALAKENAE